jgi:hypothetical protein
VKENPYRTDFPGQGPFYGRSNELSFLERAIENGRRSIAAIMGGRGMGKTSFAIELQRRLHAREISAVHLIRRPDPSPEAFLDSLGRCLGASLDALAPVDSLVQAVRTSPSSRVVLLIDEIEALLTARNGPLFLDNLRIAWEQLLGKLGIIILGGSALRDLLASNTSPFLRSAEWLPLRGLPRNEAAQLLCEPCDLSIPDELLDSLWEQTGGHPFLLQAIMEYAVDIGPPVIDKLPDAIIAVMQKRLIPTIFPIWWDNLQPHGQAVYRKLLAARRSILCSEQVHMFGPNPGPWVEILETTGVARLDGGEIVPRGALFREWMEQNHRLPARSLGSDDDLDEDVTSRFHSVHEMEVKVVQAMMRWSRDLLEYPSIFIRSAQRLKGNDRLQPEQSFQLSLLMALRQRELLVEAEALSSIRGRSDLKIRWPSEPDRRTCTELKIWGRNDFAQVIEQLIGYALLDDDFACIVMLDRLARPLDSAYLSTILADGQAGILRWQRSDRPASSGCLSFVTEHERTQGRPLRVYHFLVQLPPDSQS